MPGETEKTLTAPPGWRRDCVPIYKTNTFEHYEYTQRCCKL